MMHTLIELVPCGELVYPGSATSEQERNEWSSRSLAESMNVQGSDSLTHNQP